MSREESGCLTELFRKENSPFFIAPMRPEDVPEVAVLERSIFSMPWSENGFLSALRQPDARYLVARETIPASCAAPEGETLTEAPGRLLGYCGLLRSFEEAEIVNMAVREDGRRQGIGFALLSALMRRGREEGIERFTLEVRKSNAPALCLYEKLGFFSVGIRRNFYERPREDAVIMWTGEEDFQ